MKDLYWLSKHSVILRVTRDPYHRTGPDMAIEINTCSSLEEYPLSVKLYQEQRAEHHTSIVKVVL